jgi:hypothetical protein
MRNELSMQMVGQTIDARSRFSWAVPFFVLVAAGLIAWAVVDSNPHPALAAALPIGIALGLVLGQPSRVVLLVENDGLHPLGTPQKILYRDIIDVTVGGRPYAADATSLPSKPLEVDHERGCLIVPPLMNVGLADFYHFLVSQAPKRPPQGVPAVLTGFLAEQTTKFGQAKVQVINTRRFIEEKWRTRRRWWLSIGGLLVGLIWIAAPIAIMTSRPHSDIFSAWVFFGFLISAIALAVMFGPDSIAQNPVDRLLAKNLDSCIIVAPTGIAMIQGDTKGSLPWREITKITNYGSGWVRNRRGYGLRLQVRGAEIIVFDIYDRTPEKIEQLLRRNLDLPTT